MNRESMRLAWVGAALGLTVLSAALAAKNHPPARQAETGTSAALPAQTEVFEAEAAAVLAPESEAVGSFAFTLQAVELPPEPKLFLCDGAGCPLEEIVFDGSGAADLGPLSPGRYGVFRGNTELGGFRLPDSGAPAETTGRLWTDGTRLYLERSAVGTARFTVRLPGPGYWSFQLWDRDGRGRSGDLYVPDSALPDRGRDYLRSLEFPGLPPGLYTLARENRPLLQLTVRAGETAEAELRIEN